MLGGTFRSSEQQACSQSIFQGSTGSSGQGLAKFHQQLPAARSNQALQHQSCLDTASTGTTVPSTTEGANSSCCSTAALHKQGLASFILRTVLKWGTQA